MRFFYCFIFLYSSLYAFNLEYLQNLHSNNMQGIFTQEKHLKHFKQTLKSNGTFKIANNTLIWNIKSPIQQESKITQNGIFIKDLQTNSWHKINQNYDKELILNLITLDFKTLQKQFNTSLKGDKNQWELTLTPKNLWIKKIFQAITLKGTQKVEQIHFIEANGDRTINTLIFTDTK